MYDPTIGRWLSADPIGFEAGDANLYRYVGNTPTIYTDPSGLEKYRDDFLQATPGMSTDWRVHHTYQQRLRERYLVERGITVDDAQHLRGIDPQVHCEITSIQQQWWKAKADKDFGGSLEKAYDGVPLSEVDELIKHIDTAYSKYWVKAGASAKEIAQVEKQVAGALEDVMGRGRRITNVLNKTKVVLGAFAIFAFFAENAVFAKNLMCPSAMTQAAFNDFLKQYRYALDEAMQNGHVSKKRFGLLHDALSYWMSAAGVPQNARGIIDAGFLKAWAEM